MEYFTVGDIANQGFYPIPEKLFNNKHYQKKVKKIKKVKEKGFMVPKEIETVEELLSDTSKIVYGVMCRYLNYSLRNGWFDKDKKVYIKLSVTTLAEMLNKSRDTIIKCKKQLETVGLLEIIKEQHKADTFYLGKVKDRPEEDIVMEMESRIKDEIQPPKILEVDNIDQSKVSDEAVESIDLEVVESIDPIRVLPTRDNKRVVAEEEGNPTAAPEDNFTKNLEDLLLESAVKNTNSNTLKNISTLTNGDIQEVKRAIAFMKLKNKSMTPGILVAILRDGDYKDSGSITPREIRRDEKIEFMASKLGEQEVRRLRGLVLSEIGFECTGVDDQLGNILCRKFNEYLAKGGAYV